MNRKQPTLQVTNASIENGDHLMKSLEDLISESKTNNRNKSQPPQQQSQQPQKSF